MVARFECAWRWVRCIFVGLLLDILATGALAGAAPDFSGAKASFLCGDYNEAIRLCQTGAKEQEYNEEWRLLLVQALLTTGRYSEARGALTNALAEFKSSIRLRFLGREVMLYNDEADAAETFLEEITQAIGSRSWYYRDAVNLVVLGKIGLLLGADPRKILDNFFEGAKKSDPNLREAYLAAGQLALDKEDFKLAAKTFGEALKKFPKDADFHYGLARAYGPSDRRQMVDSLETALEYNTNHVPTLLLLADHLIDGEQYIEANKQLDQVLAVNPSQPEAWAYRSVIEHIANKASAEDTARGNALKHWKSNPSVDHLIGRKLSQKYRFSEGASHQRTALAFDPRNMPAKTQLAQDLLRLGDEEEGWRLAHEVHTQDAYDVTAFNLVTLHDTVSQFHTLTNRDFLLRMGVREAPIYGRAALDLLQKAKSALCRKYGLEPRRETIVEIFPSQKDFAVRTFGMPGNPGYLGVCFGRVITANSPASQGAHPANWNAVLWHEFCHVVTLQLTRNKMPRWLSEGISVYEERLANPSWGQAMTPQYRELILGKGLAPVSELSSAFLTAKSDLQLQFAYYESSLVVEFLVDRFGFKSLTNILASLANGSPINEAIAAHTAPLDTIEAGFATFARERARNLAPELDFEKPERSAVDDVFSNTKSNNFYMLTRHAKKLLSEKKWAEAIEPAEKLVQLFPAYAGSDNGHEMLAQAYRSLNRTNEERSVLTKLGELDADGLDTFSRLMELNAESRDWPAMKLNAERFLAVNPLLSRPHRYLAQASEAVSDETSALTAWQTLLELNPPDPAEAHYRVARLLHAKGDPNAKRHVLQALEEAPRFRDAHRLLLEIIGDKHGTGSVSEE